MTEQGENKKWMCTHTHSTYRVKGGKYFSGGRGAKETLNKIPSHPKGVVPLHNFTLLTELSVSLNQQERYVHVSGISCPHIEGPQNTALHCFVAERMLFTVAHNNYHSIAKGGMKYCGTTDPVELVKKYFWREGSVAMALRQESARVWGQSASMNGERLKKQMSHLLMVNEKCSVFGKRIVSQTRSLDKQ